MIPNETPDLWTDRKHLFLDNPDRPSPLEESVAGMSDRALLSACQRLTVCAFDPGGTTGWSVMMIDLADLANPKASLHLSLRRWYHGQVDCGAQSGNAGDSATANDYDLGISETGEAAGVAVLENIIGESIALAVGPVAVVIEDFIPREQNMSRDFLSPVRVTSRLEQLLWESRTTTLHRQQPSFAKTTATDARIKDWGMWRDGHAARHARDADRHALTFLRTLRQKQSRIRSAFPVVAEARQRGLL
ncbi:RuvC-like resolvase [Rhodococcus phage Maselop]|nr:RuvC-like resolvase [Rhodococcus phage Braxoaddie]WNM64981.1 RuvC-like resolvase [Rhodococcus phage Maselop]WNM67442.1 RuvC-like resolvase [Rhodococcus phage Polyyuki]